MKSKIKNIQASGTYDSKYGTLYKFEYEFEDGTIITANHKKDSSPYNVGDEVEYEVKGESKYGKYGSVKSPDSGDGFKKGNSYYGSDKHLEMERFKQKAIIAQSSLSNAISFHSNNPEAGEETVKQTAKEFYEFVINTAK